MSLVAAIAAGIVDALWKSTLLLSFAFALHRLLRHRPARVRWQLWKATTLGLLLIPVLGGLLPAWRLEILPPKNSEHSQAPLSLVVDPLRSTRAKQERLAETGTALRLVKPASEHDPLVAGTLEHRSSFVKRSAPAGNRFPGGDAFFTGASMRPHEGSFSEDPSIGGSTDDRSIAHPSMNDSAAGDFAFERSPVHGSSPAIAAPIIARLSTAWQAFAGPLTFAWIAVVGFFLLRQTRSQLRVRRFLTTSLPLPNSWVAQVQATLHEIGIKRPVLIRSSSEIDTPMTFGAFRPWVLLPSDALHWSKDRLHVALSHELIHVRQNDWWFGALARTACALYWFHPLAWLAAKRGSEQCEHSCDEQVLEHGTVPSDYATHLLSLAQSIQPSSPAPATALAMVRPHELESRIMEILNPHDRRRGRSTLLLVTSAAVAGTILILAPVKLAHAVPSLDDQSSSVAAPLLRLPAAKLTSSPKPLLSLPSNAVSPVPAPVLSLRTDTIPTPPTPVPTPRLVTVPSVTPPSLTLRSSVAPIATRAPRPTLPRPVRAPTPPSTITLRGNNKVSVSHNNWTRTGHDNGSYTSSVHYNDDDFQLKFQQTGEVEYREQDHSIAHMEPGSEISFAVSTTGQDFRMEIRGEGDELQSRVWLNGHERDFDRTARQARDLALSLIADVQESGQLRGQEGALRGKIGALRGKEGALRGKIGAIRGRAGALQGRIGAIRGEEGALRGKIGALRGKEGALRGKIGGLRGQLSALNARRKHVSDSDQKHIKRLIRDVEEEIEDCEHQLRNLNTDEQVRELERQLDSSRTDARIREVTRELDAEDTEAQIREVERELESLDTDEQIHEIEREIEELDVHNRVEKIDERASEKRERMKELLREWGGSSRRRVV